MATTRLPCDVCGKRFKLDKYLKTHIKMQHSIEQPNFLCPKEGCSKTCTTPYNLKIHLIDQHNEAESDVDLESLKKLHVPKDQHTAVTPKKKVVRQIKICPHCKKPIKGTGNLNKHIKKFHLPNVKSVANRLTNTPASIVQNQRPRRNIKNPKTLKFRIGSKKTTRASASRSKISSKKSKLLKSNESRDVQQSSGSRTDPVKSTIDEFDGELERVEHQSYTHSVGPSTSHHRLSTKVNEPVKTNPMDKTKSDARIEPGPSSPNVKSDEHLVPMVANRLTHAPVSTAQIQRPRRSISYLKSYKSIDRNGIIDDPPSVENRQSQRSSLSESKKTKRTSASRTKIASKKSKQFQSNESRGVQQSSGSRTDPVKSTIDDLDGELERVEHQSYTHSVGPSTSHHRLSTEVNVKTDPMVENKSDDRIDAGSSSLNVKSDEHLVPLVANRLTHTPVNIAQNQRPHRSINYLKSYKFIDRNGIIDNPPSIENRQSQSSSLSGSKKTKRALASSTKILSKKPKLFQLNESRGVQQSSGSRTVPGKLATIDESDDEHERVEQQSDTYPVGPCTSNNQLSIEINDPTDKNKTDDQIDLDVNVVRYQIEPEKKRPEASHLSSQGNLELLSTLAEIEGTQKMPATPLIDLPSGFVPDYEIELEVDDCGVFDEMSVENDTFNDRKFDDINFSESKEMETEANCAMPKLDELHTDGGTSAYNVQEPSVVDKRMDTKSVESDKFTTNQIQPLKSHLKIKIIEPAPLKTKSPAKKTNSRIQIPFGNLEMGYLKPHAIPENIKNVGIKSTFLNMSESRLSEMDYITAMSSMIYLEELENSNQLQHYSIKNAELQHSMGKLFKTTRTNNLPIDRKKIDMVIKGCILKVIGTNIMLAGSVFKIDHQFIYIKTENSDEIQYLYADEKFDIDFHGNQLPYQLQLNALNWIKEHKLFPILIENPLFNEESVVSNDSDCYFSSCKNFNETQKKAVSNIVRASNGPIPFLLFGPPGTGKTRCIVAAIGEIVRSTEKYILVTAQSNSACDELTERLLDVVKPKEIFRMYAKSVEKSSISSKIQPCSNLKNGEIKFPSLNYLYQFKVVVATLSTVGCISRARGYDRYFDSSHFSYTFIDEAACIHEPESMIAIAGVSTEIGQIRSKVILAGDPMQLAAVTKSMYAADLGYKTSYMENLFKRKCYQPNTVTGEYNTQFIVQLKENYRSHPCILSVPNELFYNGILKAVASSDSTDWFIGSQFLPNPECPIIFDDIRGKCEVDEHGSSFNMGEVNAAMDYVKRLLCWNEKGIDPSHIGIVTPYRAQCQQLEEACEKKRIKIHSSGVTIGTAEVFQGQEKPIIIISTVRTNDTSDKFPLTGFLTDPRRLNVMLTRAKALVIILGDCTALCLDKNWKKLYDYCEEKNALLRNGRKKHKRIEFPKK